MTALEKGTIIALALLANLAPGQSTITQTFTFGVVNEGAREIFSKHVEQPLGFNPEVPVIYGNQKQKIGAVVVHDHDYYKAGVATLASGGPRATSALIFLTLSQQPHPPFLNMTVLIYGAPPASTHQSCYHINLADLKD